MHALCTSYFLSLGDRSPYRFLFNLIFGKRYAYTIAQVECAGFNEHGYACPEKYDCGCKYNPIDSDRTRFATEEFRDNVPHWVFQPCLIA
jgi:hypothetical protein